MNKDWEIEFDKQFGNMGFFEEDELDKLEELVGKQLKIKDFISDLLSKQRQEMIKEIGDKYDKEYQKACKENGIISKTPRTIFHEILDSLKTKLNE